MNAHYIHYAPVSQKERKSLYECYKKLSAIPHMKQPKILRMLRLTEEELVSLVAEIEGIEKNIVFYE